MGQTALLPFRRKACWGFFFALKNPTASAGFEPANLGTKGQHATSRPPMSLIIRGYSPLLVLLQEKEKVMKWKCIPVITPFQMINYSPLPFSKHTDGHTPIVFVHGATAPTGSGSSHYRGFTITLRHTALGRTPLDEWSARRRDLYLITHNNHKTLTSIPPVGFEPAIPASELPQTRALDRAVTGIGNIVQ